MSSNRSLYWLILSAAAGGLATYIVMHTREKLCSTQVLLKLSGEVRPPEKSCPEINERRSNNRLVVDGDKFDRFVCNGLEMCPFFSQSGEERELISYIMAGLPVNNHSAGREFPYLGRNYTVMELGGLDGKRFSNSWMFEKFLGWRAILFEPSRRSYPMLVKNRPNAVCFNMAACEEERNVTFAESNELAVSGIAHTMTGHFKHVWHRGNRTSTYDVLCAPLDKYLKLIGSTRIDAFFLDVEGGELEALKGIDLNVVEFHYVIIESGGFAPEKEFEIKTRLEHHGYRSLGKVGHGRNAFFVNTQW